MFLSHLVANRAKYLGWMLVALSLLLFNLSHIVLSYYYEQQKLQQLVSLLPENLSPQQPVWLALAENGKIIVHSAAVAELRFKAVTTNSQLLFIDRQLLNQAEPVIRYTLLNILFLLVCFPVWMLLKRYFEAVDARFSKIDKAVLALQKKLNIKVQDVTPPETALTKIISHITYLLRRENEVRHLVRVQGLIDHELEIGNRIFFESRLQHYLSDVSEVAYGALFIIQVGYKETGNFVQQRVTRLKGCIDTLNNLITAYPEAVLARLSENDLVLLIPGMADRDMEKLADKMASLLSRVRYVTEHDDAVYIGYASYQQGQTAYQLLSEADMALKTALLHGPNATYGFIEQQKPPLKGSVWWRSELAKALQEQRFFLTFQPVFSWHDKEVLQQEVLIRLHTREGDKIPAAIFLPMAYNCGLAVEIDQHVLLKTARLCAAESKGGSRCSINISIQALQTESWWQWLEHAINTGLIDPELLALEISERYILRYIGQLKDKLLRLHRAGFALIIDQVGLAIDTPVNIDDLPVDTIKLHPSVVRNIDQHLEQQLFVRGLIAGYAGRGIRVIATGVEREDEWLTLQKLGIAGGQGFYFSPPLSQITTQNHPG
ncbi:EAL domain-containing protein [Chromatiaceae bacterium AAb-1]|nr:EAL domain-containing protein [Chromatiaceae bacterium AAb-1]